MNEQRLLQLESYIVENENVSLKELQYKFNVSMNTLRSDLKQLEDAGVIQKSYGEVRYFIRTPFNKRIEKDCEIKKAISKAAAAKIETNDTIFIDFGTTLAFIADYIDPKKQVTVITPNMYVIEKCISYHNAKVIITAGEYSDYNHGILSIGAQVSFGVDKLDKAFLSCDSIDANGTLQCTRISTKNVKTIALNSASKKYMLCCSDKFLVKAPLEFASIKDFDCIITDRLLRQENENLLKSAGVPYLQV